MPRRSSRLQERACLQGAAAQQGVRTGSNAGESAVQRRGESDEEKVEEAREVREARDARNELRTPTRTRRDIEQVSPYFERKGKPAAETKQQKGSSHTSKRRRVQVPLSRDREIAFLNAANPDVDEDESSRETSQGKERARPKRNDLQWHGSEATYHEDKPHRIHGKSRSESFFGMIQEIVKDDSWMVLIATMLLNQTHGSKAVPVFWKLLHQFPTPEALAKADLRELTDMIQPIGLHNIRAARLKSFSQAWLDLPPWRAESSRCRDPKARDRRLPGTSAYPLTPVAHLPGAGRYAVDSWAIFCHAGGASQGLADPDEAARSSKELAEVLRRRREVSRDEYGVSSGSIARRKEHGSLTSQVETPLWRSMIPLDKELRNYLKWRWAKEGVQFDSERGVIGQLEEEELALPQE
ncbi:Methyl-CpG binding transcription regulators [Ceraceosorus bombacis]|uniref:Methyl-CpG binding transcription regulators n=1 Tax=Ceraceosorus bombacis TaxID=401625 RepID=A0A0P1BNC3_9BASI|nr:Methyl-CpG binding transcription regulators [Ceraceosorus bombacis]